MNPAEYAAQFEEINAALQTIIDRVGNPDYCETTQRQEFSRDIAQVIELEQRRFDLYTEISEAQEYDNKPFELFCKRFDAMYGVA